MGWGFFGPAPCPGKALGAGRDHAPSQCSRRVGRRGCWTNSAWRPGTGPAGPAFVGGGGVGSALPGPGVVSGGGVWELCCVSFPAPPAGGRVSRDFSQGDEAEPGGPGSAQGGQKRRAASMFSRNHRSRVTVARGSALEMEFKRGRFRLSLFSDPPEVRAPHPSFPCSPGLREPRLPLPRPCTRRGAETLLAVFKPVVIDLKSRAPTVCTLIGLMCNPRHSLVQWG